MQRKISTWLQKTSEYRVFSGYRVLLCGPRSYREKVFAGQQVLLFSGRIYREKYACSLKNLLSVEINCCSSHRICRGKLALGCKKPLSIECLQGIESCFVVVEVLEENMHVA